MRPILRPILHVLAGFVLFLAAMEGVLRVLPVFVVYPSAPVDASSPIMRGLPHQPFEYSKGWHFRLRNTGSTNNYGFFSSYDYAPDQPCVAVIGDSFVHAAAVAAPLHFSELLDARTQALGARTYTFGRPGGSISDYLSVARWVAGSFKPRAMVLLIAPGDVDESLDVTPGGTTFRIGADGTVAEKRYDWSPDRSPLADAVHSLRLFYYLNGNLNFAAANARHRRKASRLEARAPDAQVRGRLIDYFLQTLPAATALSKSQLIFLIDCDRPALYRGQASQPRDIDQFGGRARELGFPVVDLCPFFRDDYDRYHVRFDAYPEDRHFNARGHAILARAALPAVEQALGAGPAGH